MGHSVTLGGDRLGSGNKNKTYLHNYERSTHDNSTDFLSTMGCGMLIPFMCELVTRDDKYEIDLDAGLRTIPTQGPMFGSFKLQVDVFKYPLRLCQALMHNNPMAIGLKANQVKWPKMRLYGQVGNDENEITTLMAANNSLVKYLQISGIGSAYGNEDEFVFRDMFGAGLIAYYDIFKNYYANKQEKYAYTIGRGVVKSNNKEKEIYKKTTYISDKKTNDTEWYTEKTQYNNETYILSYGEQIISKTLNIEYQRTALYDTASLKLSYEDIKDEKIGFGFYDITSEDDIDVTYKTIQEWVDLGLILNITFSGDQTKNNLIYTINNEWENVNTHIYATTGICVPEYWHIKVEDVILNKFELENIDKMRYNILSFHQLGQSFILDGDAGSDEPNYAFPPYWNAIGGINNNYWQEPLAGICVKTYQSDLFNNWLNTEIIDGENGIAEITAIATSSGSITIDQIQFSEKLYNLLNRIAVSGGTYQDYLDAAYTESAKRFEESPMWVGGLSDEIIFEEIVQTAPTDGDPLGTMGGRGNLMGKTKGGKITVKIDEPALLIGIVSITPRIVYTQGNTWFNTELDSLQDIHVPALDAIGFQNLIGEELHAGSTIINANGSLQPRPIVGKVPAWIHYMTNVDRAYGDFAAGGGEGYMVLNRDYEIKNGILQDATTYIDPAKFNYAFAYTKRDAQNFWVKIKADIKARRLMSAKQIPTA